MRCCLRRVERVIVLDVFSSCMAAAAAAAAAAPPVDEEEEPVARSKMR